MAIGLLTPREQAVMDCWDAGQTLAAIARHTGTPRRKVSNIVSNYHDDGGFDRDIRQGSARLLAALRREGFAAS